MEKKKLGTKGGRKSLAAATVLKEDRRGMSLQHSGSIRGPFSNRMEALNHAMLSKYEKEQYKLTRNISALDHLPSLGLHPTTTDHCQSSNYSCFPSSASQKFIDFDQNFSCFYRSQAADMVGSIKPQLRSARRSVVPPQYAISVAMASKNHFRTKHCPASVPSPLAASLKRSPTKQQALQSQMTIFYQGTVIVYDDITSAKAQAIMQLASKRPKESSTSVTSSVQTPAVNHVDIIDEVDNIVATNCLSNSNHLSFASTIGTQTGIDDMELAKGVRHSTMPLKPGNATDESALTTAAIMPRAIPQARKATLARFLEMRKERLINCIPYSYRKNSLDTSNGMDCERLSRTSKSSVKHQMDMEPLLMLGPPILQ